MGLIKLLGLLFCIINAKSIPLAYVVRFYWKLFKTLGLPARKYRAIGRKNTFNLESCKNKLALFEPTTFKSFVNMMEIDPYIHKSNSTYFLDLDIARTELVCKVFQKYFLDTYDNIDGEFKGRALSNFPYVPIATVKCVFKKDLKLFQSYTIKSQVLAWDRKWLFVISKFCTKRGNSETLCAVALTKYVFKKKGRITISPQEMIERSDLYNDEVEAVNAKNYKLVEFLSSQELFDKAPLLLKENLLL